MDRRKAYKGNRSSQDRSRLKVSVSNQQKILSISKASVSSIVQAFIAREAVSCSEIAIFFVTRKKISVLHEQFFQDPSPTDCISFPIDFDSSIPDRYLGDLFIAPETALIYAQKKGLDPYEETTLYLVHGLLHLIGFTDCDPQHKRQMRAREKFHMIYLKQHSLLLKPRYTSS